MRAQKLAVTFYTILTIPVLGTVARFADLMEILRMLVPSIADNLRFEIIVRRLADIVLK